MQFSGKLDVVMCILLTPENEKLSGPPSLGGACPGKGEDVQMLPLSLD